MTFNVDLPRRKRILWNGGIDAWDLRHTKERMWPEGPAEVLLGLRFALSCSDEGRSMWMTLGQEVNFFLL